MKKKTKRQRQITAQRRRETQIAKGEIPSAEITRRARKNRMVGYWARAQLDEKRFRKADVAWGKIFQPNTPRLKVGAPGKPQRRARFYKRSEARRNAKIARELVA
jgi:hypothetical protein